MVGCFDMGTEKYSNPQSFFYGEPVCIVHQHCICQGEFVCDRCWAVNDSFNLKVKVR